MKLKKGFTLRELAGEHILVGEGLEQVNFNKIITLNNSAAYLWESLCNKEDFDIETAVELILDKYDIDKETAYKDSQNLINSWIEAGLAEE